MSTAVAERDDLEAGIHTTDRCDRCIQRAQAVVLVDTERGMLPLEFCGHHLARHRDRLAIEGFEILAR